MLVVTVISVNLYFLRLSQTQPVTFKIWEFCFEWCFLVALCCLIVRRLNLEIATTRLLHQQVEIPTAFLVVWLLLRSLDVICFDR